jgi:hypothetical protein
LQERATHRKKAPPKRGLLLAQGLAAGQNGRLRFSPASGGISHETAHDQPHQMKAELRNLKSYSGALPREQQNLYWRLALLATTGEKQ